MDEYKIVKFEQNGVMLDVTITLEKGTAWLSIDDMALLYSRDRSTIGKHIRTIIKEEFDKGSVWAKFARTGTDDKQYYVDYYNLDIVIAVGYRVKSQNGLMLRDFVEEFITNYKRNEDQSIIIYNNGDITLPVTISPKEETVWLGKDDLMLLFDTTRQNVEYHIENIYKQDELEVGATCKEFLQVQLEGGREVTRIMNVYNLDMIISLGYRINTKNGIIFRRWATRVLKEYLLKGYVIDKNRTLVTDENYVNLINKVENVLEKKIDELDARLTKIEELDVVIKEKIYFDGAYFDARLFIKDIFAKAENSILLIDPYTDIKTLDYLTTKKKEVCITLCCSSRSTLSQSDIDSFIKQYGQLIVVKNDAFHDRFIIIDNKELYHIGASLNYVGKRVFAITKMDGDGFIDLLVNKIKKENT